MAVRSRTVDKSQTVDNRQMQGLSTSPCESRSSDKATGPVIGQLSIGDDRLTQNESLDIPFGALDQPSCTSRQILDAFGRAGG